MNRFAAATAAILLAGAALAPLSAGATAPAPPTGLAEGASPGQGVVSYTADFFAVYKPNTAWDMVRRLPGFSFDPGAQVRGFADAAGNVLIDGERPTSKQDDLGTALSRIQADQVERIDVISGGAPGIDMQGHTVMANVILKTGGVREGVVQLQDKLSLQSGRNIPGSRLEYTQKDNGQSFTIGFLEGGYLDNGAGSGPHTTSDGTGDVFYASHLWTSAFGYTSSLTSAFETPLAGGRFRINGLIGLDNYIDHEADTAYLPPVGGNDAYSDKADNFKGELGVHYTHDLGPQATIETLVIQQAARHYEQSIFDEVGDDQLFSIKNLTSETIGRSVVTYTPWSYLTLETAVEGAYNTLDTGTFYAVNSVLQPLPAANEQVSEKRGELQFKSTWTPMSQYTVEAGVRLEDSNVAATGDVQEGKSLFYLKPRVVFIWAPEKNDQVRLRVEREVGQLDFGAFSASGSLNVGGLHAGNPNVVPQQDWVYESAFEHRFWNGGDATVTLRHEDITDAVDRIAIFDAQAQAFFDEGGNLPKGTENDLIADLTIPLDLLGLKNAQFKTTGTWRETQVIDPITGMARPQSGVHPFEWGAHYTQDLTALSSTWGMDFFDGFTEHDYRFDEIDVFHFNASLNAYYEYKPTPKLSFRVDAINLFSHGIQKTITDYAGPRNLNPVPDEIDFRSQQIGSLLNFRVRRTF
jgi:hypothetical protein